MDQGLTEAAGLFKVLGNESRLRLLRLMGQAPRTVGALAEASGLSQPLVSQHLRTLRSVSLVASHRHGKEVTYMIADAHIVHIVADALVHVQETLSHTSPPSEAK